MFHQSIELNQFVSDIADPAWQAKGVKLKVLRLDLLHPQVSGNKWLKLKGTLEHAKSHDLNQIVSFGGPYSNHLHALAWAGQAMGIKTHGIVRGRPEFINNPTLSDVVQWGMSLSFVNYETYRQRFDQAYLSSLQDTWGRSALLVPEGGAGPYALSGFIELFAGRPVCDETHLAVAAGTGGTLAGLLAAVAPEIQVLAVPVIKGATYLLDDVRQMLITSDIHDIFKRMALQRIEQLGDALLDHEGHYGGYGKAPPDLMRFIDAFEMQHGIPFEPVYTGKLFKRLYERLEGGHFSAGDCVLAIHTGGLQGNRGFGR